jgi:hypothetical protein
VVVWTWADAQGFIVVVRYATLRLPVAIGWTRWPLSMALRISAAWIMLK